jgi:SNF2 family DNA or RNA helicase
MLRIPGLCGLEARELDLMHNRLIAQARREQSDEDKQAHNEALQQQLTASKDAMVDLPPHPVTAAKYFFVYDIKQKLQHHMIRRTSRSLKNDGEPINAALPPKTEIVYTIHLTDREMKELTQELAYVSKAHGSFAMFAFEVSFLVWTVAM